MDNDALSKTALRSRVVNAYIETPQTRRAKAALESCRIHHLNAEEGVPQNHLAILGNPRAGKSRMLLRYSLQSENKAFIEKDVNGDETMIIPVVYVSLYRPFTIIGFYQQILDKLGRPVHSSRPTIDNIRRATMNLLNDQGVKVLILDEIQCIFYSPYVKPLNALETIKDVSDNGKVSIIVSGLPEAKALLNTDDQYAFRFRTFEMLPFEEYNMEFISFVKDFEDQIKAPFPLGISDNPTRCELLFKVTGGLVGKVYDFFEELFVQMGIDNPDISLSQMKVTNSIVIKTADIVKNRRKL